MEVKGFGNMRLGFNGGKEAWHQGGANGLGFHAA